MLSWVEGRNKHVVWMRWSPTVVLIHVSSLIGLMGSSQGQRCQGCCSVGLWLCGKPGSLSAGNYGRQQIHFKTDLCNWRKAVQGCNITLLRITGWVHLWDVSWVCFIPILFLSLLGFSEMQKAVVCLCLAVVLLPRFASWKLFSQAHGGLFVELCFLRGLVWSVK